MPLKLFRISDASGTLTFQAVHPPLFSALSSADAFLLDDTRSTTPAIYLWLGNQSSLNERRLAIQYAQTYLNDLEAQEQRSYSILVATHIVKMAEGHEGDAFMRAIGRDDVSLGELSNSLSSDACMMRKYLHTYT